MHEGSGKKIQNVGSQSCIAYLSRINCNQLARLDALVEHFRHAQHERPEEPFHQRRKSIRLAAMQANHFLLHQALESRIGVEAIEVTQR